MRIVGKFVFPITTIVSIALGVCQAQSLLTRHVRKATQDGTARPMGQLSASKTMNLVITLPLHNQDELDQFLQDVYDPTARITGNSSPWNSSPSSSARPRQSMTP